MKTRLLLTGANTAAYNMALDEIVMNDVRENKVPTLRFYSWKPSAVSIGYFQSLKEEVDLEKCKEFGVDVVRRQTGGGAVFHEHELTYSFITIEHPENIIESYKWVCGGILKGLETFGINGQFVPLNDLVYNGKKFSGNAQTRKKGVMLQHGTILLKVDVEKMFSLLKVPNEKLKGKLIENIKQRVTAVDKTFEEVEKALRKGFSESLNLELYEDKIADEEEKAVEELIKTKYGNREWNELR